MPDDHTKSQHPKRRVAVVAVHGVGRHEAGASASAIADLLLSLRVGNPYSSFATDDIDIPLPEPDIFKPQLAPQVGKSSLWDMFEERRGYFEDRYSWKAWISQGTADARTETRAELPNIVASEFMKVQLAEYRGNPERSSYSTRRIVGRRAPEGSETITTVHIYEMYWSDLARPTSSLLSFFFAFYQLLLHVTSLGRTAVDQAALEHMGQLDWFAWQRLYSYASRVLTLFVFILLVILPVVAFAPLPLLLKGPTAETVAAAILLVAVLGFILWCSQRWDPWFGWSWWAFAFTGAAAIVVVCVMSFLKFRGSATLILELEWWLGAALVLFGVVFPKYDEVRNGAIQMGWFLGTVVLGGFIVCLCYAGWNTQGMRIAAFQMIQWVFLAVRLGWVLVILFAILAAIAEVICRFRHVGQDRDRARAAGRTARFALALPAVLLMLVTIFLWSGIFSYTISYIHPFDGVNPRIHGISPAYDHGLLLPPDTDDPETFLESLLFQGAPPGLPVVLGMVVAGFLLLILTVLPSIYYEQHQPANVTDLKNERKARLLGNWLSRGLNLFPWIIACFWLSAFCVPVIYVVAALVSYYLHGNSGDPFLKYFYSWWMMPVSHRMLVSSGVILAGSATLISGLLLTYSSAALDILLDVDNYLRTTPSSNTPRARIVERYLALLHFLHSYGYDGIVIVAHSLGSVISADLLHYLARQGAETKLRKYAFAKRSIPIVLFTMGNPLRQLLNRFFPVLYGWVRSRPDSGSASPAAAAPSEEDVRRGGETTNIPENACPNAADLGVQSLMNAYRSGDYVGRSLWLDNLVADTADKNYPLTSNCREFCIGFGAHTHYWDRTAPKVAQLLDEQIKRLETLPVPLNPA